MLVFDAAARSSRGPRPDNQDSALATPSLIAVADGVGGNVGGAGASALVLSQLLLVAFAGGLDQLGEDPRALLPEVGARLADAVGFDARMSAMSTTLVAAVIRSTTVTLLSVGDSRAYLHSHGELTQLTRDHTLVQMMLDSGNLTIAEAAVHPYRSRLYAAISATGDPPSADVLRVDVMGGDRLLLCSDGLSDTVPPSAIADTLAAKSSPDDAAAALLDVALQASDNVTVVVADVRDSAEPPPYVQTAGAIAQLQIPVRDDSRTHVPEGSRGWERSDIE